MRLPFRVLPLVVLAPIGFGIVSPAAAQGTGQIVQTPPGIPVVTASTPPFGMVYDYVERTDRSSKDRDALLSAKMQQYAEKVKEGSITQGRADETLQRMRTMPLREERRGTLTLIFDRGRVMVTGAPLDGTKAWTRIEDGLAVSSGWSGGDAWTLTNRAEPYSDANTLVPVMPLQLPTVKSFADLELEGDTGKARMFAVSTTSDRYLVGTLRFERGRLAETEISKLERTRFSDYTGGAVPLPKRIVLERLYDADGTPQVVRTYTGRPLPHPTIPSLKELVPPAGIVVLDERTEPTRQFTYRPTGGSISEQAAGGQAIPSVARLPDATGTSTPFSTWLLAGSLLLLVGTALARIILGRRTMAIKRG